MGKHYVDKVFCRREYESELTHSHFVEYSFFKAGTKLTNR